MEPISNTSSLTNSDSPQPYFTPNQSLVAASSLSSNESSSLPYFTPRISMLSSAHSLDVESSPSTFAQILTLEEYEILQALEQLNPLPKRYKLKSHQTAAFIFAAIAATAASVLYVEGGAKYGIMPIIGGVSVNLTQNILFGMSTYFFFQTSLNNLKKHRALFALACSIGLVTTGASFVSTYYFSNGSIIKAAANATGNFPLNIYGAYNSILHLSHTFSDNPKVRAFLNDILKDSLANNFSLQRTLKPTRSLVTKVSSLTLGIGLGASLGAASAGYLCVLSHFYGEKLDNDKAGIAASFISMAPMLMVAMFISGMELSKNAVHLVADIYQHITNQHHIHMSYREKKIAAIAFLCIGVSSWLALYSSATSKYAYAQECDIEPTAGSFINLVLRFLSDQGAQVFNAIMSGIAIHAAFGFYKEAYCEDESLEQQTYQVEHVEKIIETASAAELEAIAEKYAPEAKHKWQKEPTCLSKTYQRYWKPQDNSRYQALEESKEESVDNNPIHLP